MKVLLNIPGMCMLQAVFWECHFENLSPRNDVDGKANEKMSTKLEKHTLV